MRLTVKERFAYKRDRATPRTRAKDCTFTTRRRCVRVVLNHIVCAVSHPCLTRLSGKAIRFGMVAAVMTATGIAGAIVVGVGVGYVVSDRHFGFGALGIVIAAVMMGYPLGAIAGLFLLRNRRGIHGSLPLAVIGCVIGAVLPVFVTGGLNLVMEPSILLAAYFVSIPVLGSFGYLQGGVSSDASQLNHRNGEGR